MQPEVAPRRRAAGLRPACAASTARRTRATGTAHFIRLEQRSVHHETTHASIEQLRNLRREVDGIGIVQARAAVDVGADGHDLAVDILERELAGTQAAAGTIVDAAVGNLQNAMLACHDARAAKDGDAQSRGAAAPSETISSSVISGESQNAPAPRSASASMQGVL